MTEEEFIKKYFQKQDKVNINESIGKEFVGNIINFAFDSNPLAQFAKHAIGYGASRLLSKGSEKLPFSSRSNSSSSSSSSSKDKSKDDKTGDKYIKNLSATIQNDPTLYLKFFLIYFALYVFNNKIIITLNQLDDIYKNLQNENFISPFDKKTTLYNTQNITEASIYYKNEEIKNKDGFKAIMKGLFIDKKDQLGIKFKQKIDQLIGSSYTFNQSSIKSVFMNFFETNGFEYTLDKKS